jgi:hypothetical protein
VRRRRKDSDWNPRSQYIDELLADPGKVKARRLQREAAFWELVADRIRVRIGELLGDFKETPAPSRAELRADGRYLCRALAEAESRSERAAARVATLRSTGGVSELDEPGPQAIAHGEPSATESGIRTAPVCL